MDEDMICIVASDILANVGADEESWKFILERIKKCQPSAVTEQFVFFQNRWLTNVWKWKPIEGAETNVVGCKDVPISWISAGATRPRWTAWREKKDGVAYVRSGRYLEGDESIEIPEGYDIEAGERINNVLYVLKPYTFSKAVSHNGVEFRPHPWRTDACDAQGDGIVLLGSDGEEYRLKFVPTIESLYYGQVYEMMMQGDFLVPLRPRYGKETRSEAECKHYLSSVASLNMMKVAMEGPPPAIQYTPHDVIVSGKGDMVVIDNQMVRGRKVFSNVARVKTSAKVLIQDHLGNILLVREGVKGWDLPGGKADHLDELPSAIVGREVREELGWEMPQCEWKAIRRTSASLAFLYHWVVGPRKAPEGARWFSIGDYMRLRTSDMVSWLPSLLFDVLRSNGYVHISTADDRLVLHLGPGGSPCRGTVLTPAFVKTQGSTGIDLAGNRVIDGKYADGIVPVTLSSVPLPLLPDVTPMSMRAICSYYGYGDSLREIEQVRLKMYQRWKQNDASLWNSSIDPNYLSYWGTNPLNGSGTLRVGEKVEMSFNVSEKRRRNLVLFGRDFNE